MVLITNHFRWPVYAQNQHTLHWTIAVGKRPEHTLINAHHATPAVCTHCSQGSCINPIASCRLTLVRPAALNTALITAAAGSRSKGDFPRNIQYRHMASSVRGKQGKPPSRPPEAMSSSKSLLDLSPRVFRDLCDNLETSSVRGWQDLLAHVSGTPLLECFVCSCVTVCVCVLPLSCDIDNGACKIMYLPAVVINHCTHTHTHTCYSEVHTS